MKGRLAAALMLGAAMIAPATEAQAPVSCEQEIGSMRWLVQRYASERTALEFALAASEARRQAAEARLKALEEVLKYAPKGQK